MTFKQVCRILLFGVWHSLRAALLAAVFFGAACWALYLFGFLREVDAIFKVRLAIICYGVLGFVLAVRWAVRMPR